jgi:phosphoribosylamine--glycine ligase
MVSSKYITPLKSLEFCFRRSRSTAKPTKSFPHIIDTPAEVLNLIALTRMKRRRNPAPRSSAPNVLVLGVGSFAQSVSQTLGDAGANVFCYLTRPYAQFPPSLVAKCFRFEEHPSPVPLLRKQKIDFILPMSIDWAQKPWTEQLLESGVPIVCPSGEALNLERDRDFARQLCEENGIPFPRSHFAPDLASAQRILKRDPRPYVIKNPICGPGSPVHTIVCESPSDTAGWLPRLNYAEGIFMQEYMGRAEAGHIAFVSGGEIYSLVTNQEYKRAFNNNMGIVAGAPLGGLVEQDPDDKYGLARELIHPLRDWFRETNFHGPVQVTAIYRNRKWHVLEYNVRIGVTSGPIILRMLRNPLETLRATVRNEPLAPKFRSSLRFGCSLTLAGFGYPYVQVTGPELPVETHGRFDCDVWWNEVRKAKDGTLLMTGHRIADAVATSGTLEGAIKKAYSNIKKIRCLGSYYRTDVGQSLWPPGNE